MEHYNFEINILRVNRNISKETTKVFYQGNCLIKVNNHFVDAEKSMYNHEIPFFKVKGQIGRPGAQVSIAIDPFNARLAAAGKIATKPKVCILLLEDIPNLTRLLRLLNLASFMGYKFEITLRHPQFAEAISSIAIQTQLLTPFEQARGCALVQNVTFSGPFDSAIVQRVKQVMTQKIAWLRSALWELHDIALSVKRMGDWAFHLQNIDMALAKYEDTRNFIAAATELNSMMRGLDADCKKALYGIECTTWVDTALLMISDAMLEEAGERMYSAVPSMVNHIKAAEDSASKHSPRIAGAVMARFYYVLGIAELGLNHPIKAAKALAKAYKIISDTATETGYNLAKDWSDLGKTTRATCLDKLLCSLPSEPLGIPDMKEYCTTEVTSEHWVMRELGHQGPIPYEDKIKPALGIMLTHKPHPNHPNQGPRTVQVGYPKPEILRKHVERYRKSMNLPQAQGGLTCWVGLRLDEIGVET